METYPTLTPQTPVRLLGSLALDSRPAALPGGTGYIAKVPGDGLLYTFRPGEFTGAQCLAADFLLDGVEAALFLVTLREGANGPAFTFHFGLLNQCSARMRLPLVAVNQNRWMFDREGAWLKPLAGGARVDLARVDRMTITILRKGDGDVRWWQTAVVPWMVPNPPKVDKVLLPKGPLLDEMGQWTLRDWEGKSGGSEEVTNRLRTQWRRNARAYTAQPCNVP